MYVGIQHQHQVGMLDEPQRLYVTRRVWGWLHPLHNTLRQAHAYTVYTMVSLYDQALPAIIHMHSGLFILMQIQQYSTS